MNNPSASRVASRALEAYTSYQGDPRWMSAKFPGKADDGTPFRRGDRVLYWPRTKTFMVGEKAEVAWQRFEGEAEDEDAYSQRYATLHTAYTDMRPGNYYVIRPSKRRKAAAPQPFREGVAYSSTM